MPAPLRVLIIEDRPDDAELIAEHLRDAGLMTVWERVDSEADFVLKLNRGLDLIIADYHLPQFDAPRALDILKKLDFDIPFIVVSGTVGEDAAVAVMRRGARDYVFKDNLSRLRPAVEREVHAATERKAARAAQGEYLRRLSSIFDSALDALVTMDADGLITDWNPMAQVVFGWPKSEAVGRLVTETIMPSRYREAHRLGLRRFLETGQGPVLNTRLELEGLHRDGHEFPIELAISATKTGSSHLFSAFVRDITERHRAEEALRASEERYRRIVETAFEGVWIIDSNNRTTFVNHRMAEMLGYAPEEMLGRPVLTFMDHDAQAAFAANREQRQQAHQPEHEFRFRRKDGSELWALLESSPDLDAAGNYRGSLAMVTDVTERRRGQEALRRLAAMVATSSDAIMAVDLTGSILNWNRGAERMYGYTAEEIIGRSILTITPDAKANELTAILNQARRGEPIEPVETLRKRKDGSLVEVSISFSTLADVNGSVIATTGIHRDISNAKRAAEALQASEERYRRIVETAYEGIWVIDAQNMTTFVNPRLAEMLGWTVEEIMGRSVLDFLDADARATFAAKQQAAVLILDLDHFKEVNETFGLQAGDRLLEQVGPRLQSEIGADDMVARLSGDEFAMLLTDTDAAAASVKAARLLEALERPFEVEGQHLDLAASIGIAIFPTDGDDPGTLLRHADIALFVAKQARGAFVRFAPEHEKQGANRLTLMAELRQALHDDDQLFLQFQPLVSLRDRSLAGVEALVRWQHPQRGLVPPTDFVPFAEKTGLVQPLTKWVLASALKQSAAWHRDGHPIPVSVNISMRDLVDPGFPQLVSQLLRDAKAEPSWVRLEITESVIMSKPEQAINTLSQLRKLGIRLAVDDFGTGYSSLAYLDRLPVDEIKIDKSFVSAMAGE